MRTRRAALFFLALTLAPGARTSAAAGPWAGYAVLELSAHLTGIARPQCDDVERARQFLNAAVGANRVPVLCTERAFFDSDGFEPANYRGSPSVSGDGRYVAYESGGLVFGAEGPDGGAALLLTSVLVYDRLLGTTVLASASSEGTPGEGSSGAPAISGDGRYVAFASNASNLVAGDGNGATDVFVRDLATGATERVSVAAGDGDAGGASYAPSISWDGRYVAFESVAANLLGPGEDANGKRDAFVRDRVGGVTERVSVATGGAEGDAHSRAARVSASPNPALDGRWVAFVSDATNLLPDGADGNGLRDVFVRDREAHATERASVTSDGAEADGASQPGDFFGDARAPAISADGRFVAFGSDATNLIPTDGTDAVEVFVREWDLPEPYP